MDLHNLPSNHRCQRQYDRQENLNKKGNLSQNTDDYIIGYVHRTELLPPVSPGKSYATRDNIKSSNKHGRNHFWWLWFSLLFKYRYTFHKTILISNHFQRLWFSCLQKRGTSTALPSKDFLEFWFLTFFFFLGQDLQIYPKLLAYMSEKSTSSIIHINRRNSCMLHKCSKIRIQSTKPFDLQTSRERLKSNYQGILCNHVLENTEFTTS